MSQNNAVQDLLARSNRLGSNPKYTNFAGGNTSAVGERIDPSTGESVELLYVKGSGGDLGTLQESGLAVLYLERLRALANVYRGEDFEDEMVNLFDFCTFGRSGAAPSIDTAMHALVAVSHVDHLHPDSIIAFATAVDGEALTKKCFGDEILWVDWRRPGFQLGLEIAELARKNPSAHGCILGGHGLTTWAQTSEECEKRSIESIAKAERFLVENGKPNPFGSLVVEAVPLEINIRRKKASQLSATFRGIASRDQRMVGHFSDSEVVLEFLSSSELPRLGALGTSCPDHFLRTKISPMVLDTCADSSVEEIIIRAEALHEQYRENYAAYYNRYATTESPAMRGALHTNLQLRRETFFQ